MSYEDEAREYHEAIWQMRERQPGGEPLPWWHISNALGVPDARLKQVRLAAQRIGLAVKDPATGRVTWLPPASGR